MYLLSYIVNRDSFLLQNIILKDPSTHSAMLVPVMISSDKTVSVGTGHIEYWPVCLSEIYLTTCAMCIVMVSC